MSFNFLSICIHEDKFEPCMFRLPAYIVHINPMIANATLQLTYLDLNIQ